MGKMPYAEEGSEKKKKKFWDIFRRRRKGSDSSSDDDDDIKRRGFLGRKKKDRGSKDVTNSFYINPVIRTENLKNSVESVKSNNSSELSGRRRIKAKVEASRELLAQDSSSDEGSYTSYTSSLHSGGSFPRRSRAARTERHNRRMSRDFEGRVNKWTANIVYQESKDYDTKYRAKARSATPSPAQSPQVKRAASQGRNNFKSTSTDNINGKRAPPTPPPRKEPRPQSLADPPRYYPPVYTAPSHLIQARLRQSSQKSVSEQYLARLKMESARSVSPRPTRTESTSSVSSESFGKKEDLRPLSIVVEKSEISDMDARKPPQAPVLGDRRTPRRSSSVSSDILEARKHSSNLEEALNELEAIYKKLACDEKSYDSSMNGEALPTDDMAYRRLNKREPSCQDIREIMGQAGSYLLVSPTLSPPPIIGYIPPHGEPDVTYDDVVFRSVQHSNNSLKCLDPQPPFGIPLGPISPAANSDYLHAQPMPMPTSSGSIPDLVLDDLAFRNLRKDHSKKKAVRSMSANLSGLINRNYINNNNLNLLNNNLEEKSHSYSDIPEEMRLAQKVLDMRKNKKSQKKEEIKEARQRFFSDRTETECALLEQLAAETKATSDQIDRELRQLSGVDYTKSMTDLLQEMTKNLNYDFGCQACTKEKTKENKYQPIYANYRDRWQTRPGSIGPPRPRNPFKEDPWGKKREPSKQEVNGDRDSLDDDVFYDDHQDEGTSGADEACREIRQAASGLCWLEKEQEECPAACERVNMVVTATHNMKDTREERMARYKEERRRALAAQFGPRDPAASSPRSTRASRLRTLANTDNHSLKTSPAKEEEETSNGDACKKEKDKSAKRKSYLNRSHTSEPTPPSGESGARRRSGLISTNVSGMCVSGPKKPITNQNSSPIPKSSQLVRNQLISNQKNERGSTPESDASSSSSRFSKKSGTVSSPANLSPSHKNVRSRTINGTDVRSNSGSPAKAPHSILKKPSIEEQTSPLHSITLPVSILKRKTSQDETVARCASPVRFSPSVIEKKGRGILKKHRSLDEAQVELHNLQEGIEEAQRNGKNGDRRRCSLEEVSRRSPEPQGILKRKASREESEPTPEPPQSILKRRSSPLVSTESLSPEPILKRKDEPHVEPRPILKKKSSSEEEEYAVRPILKESPARRLTTEIRPILKLTEESQSQGVLMRPRARRGYPGENRLSLDSGLLRRLDEPRPGRPLSVAERVQSMETAFNSLDGTINAISSSPTVRMDEEECSKGLERSGSVSERASIFAQLEQKEKQAAEAAKARRISKGLRNRNKLDRFSTQPVTVVEVEQAKRNNDPNCDEPSKLTLAERVALFTQREESQKKAPAPPPPRRISQAPLLVEGLMKNLAEKSGARAPLITRKLSTSSTSSESENGQDDRLSPNREFEKEMGEVRTLRRCATQPISARDEADDAKPLTIAERLAALKQNGHSNWMKRIARTSPEEELLSAKPPPSGGSRFSEKLGQLEVAAEGWKARVTTPDSHQFSVAGKMGTVSTPQPALGGANRTPTPQVFTQSQGVASMSTPSVPDSLAALMKRSISVPEGKENEPSGDAPVVQVPEPYDEDFSSFFLSPDLERLADIGDVDLPDLEYISSQTSHLSVVKRNVRVTRKHRSANPLKALAQRSDLRTEYVEVKSGVADREIRRINIEKLSKNSNMAVEALAGLASKEDIGGVFLKKVDTPSGSTTQWTHPLLLRVKGRRHPITSVVKPVYTSINQGDSFILVTKDQVFHWIGEYCSLTEKSRGSDIAQDIAHRKDLGCTGATNVVTLESSGSSERHKEFWRLLALPDLLMSSYKGENPGHPEEDSVYEVAMSETYMVYRLCGDRLVPVEQYWGRIPKVAILNPTQVLVFDFRSEVYIWSGKNADMAEKRIGTRLAQELFKGGYKSCWYPTGITWLDEEMSKNERPEWSILRRITQHMEPVIFREKFLDWPDFSKIIQAKLKSVEGDLKVDGSVEVRPCDIKDMLSWQPPEPDLILEGTHLGRGKSYYDEETRRLFEVKTLTVDIWHIHDYSRTPLDKSSFGHFHRGDSYVIRWNYSVTVTGRELSGEPSKHGSTGRERVAYLTWHGSEAPSLEQGAAALHTVDLDSEAAAQLVVECGREPPVFLSLLSSPLVVHSNSRAGFRLDKEPPTTRLYIVTGEEEEETRLDEVEVSEKSLRSKASLWLFQVVKGTSILWHGCASTVKHQATKAVHSIARSPPPELVASVSSIKVEEIEEGDEPEEFLGGSDNINRSSYSSQLTKTSVTPERQARLYHLTSLTGELTAVGVPSLRTRSKKEVSTFPYLQDDLYSASQPAVFILESTSRVWVWTGWSPADADERGSHLVRHQAEKRAAHTVALGFARAVNSNPADVVTVVAGLEPPAFTSLFSTWSVNEEAKAASLEDGWSEDEMRNTQEELALLMRESYPLHTLTSTPLPAGVDPTRLELYLNTADFKDVFGMDKGEFSELPAWKQAKLKKSANLF